MDRGIEKASYRGELGRTRRRRCCRRHRLPTILLCWRRRIPCSQMSLCRRCSTNGPVLVFPMRQRVIVRLGGQKSIVQVSKGACVSVRECMHMHLIVNALITYGHMCMYVRVRVSAHYLHLHRHVYERERERRKPKSRERQK